MLRAAGGSPEPPLCAKAAGLRRARPYLLCVTVRHVFGDGKDRYSPTCTGLCARASSRHCRSETKQLLCSKLAPPRFSRRFKGEGQVTKKKTKITFGEIAHPVFETRKGALVFPRKQRCRPHRDTQSGKWKTETSERLAKNPNERCHMQRKVC